MTTLRTTRSRAGFRLPDPPPREPDEMTSFEHLHAQGSAHHLIRYYGNPETTLVTAERYVSLEPRSGRSRRRRPDLLIAFNVKPSAYIESNGYIISEQGKPPDFVLEVASESTGEEDVGEKREDYASFGIPEYWRFDETGEYHGDRLAGDRLVDGEYQPIEIEQLSEDVLQGYSEVLDLYIRWNAGRLEWYDPATGRHIPTFDDEREARMQAENRADLAEARVRELQDELRRLRES